MLAYVIVVVGLGQLPGSEASPHLRRQIRSILQPLFGIVLVQGATQIGAFDRKPEDANGQTLLGPG
jgi:hypothetical protein